MHGYDAQFRDSVMDISDLDWQDFQAGGGGSRQPLTCAYKRETEGRPTSGACRGAEDGDELAGADLRADRGIVT